MRTHLNLCLGLLLLAVACPALAQKKSSTKIKPEPLTLTGSLRRIRETKVDPKTRRKRVSTRFVLLDDARKATYLSFSLPKDTEKPDVEPLIKKKVTIKCEGYHYVRGKRRYVKITKLESFEAFKEEGGGDFPGAAEEEEKDEDQTE